MLAEDELMCQIVDSSDEMHSLGGSLATGLFDGLAIYLRGPLGAGKTTLVRGLIQSLGHVGSVKSPTYNLIASYQTGGFCIHHFDLYRLGDPEELELIGVRDYFSADAVCLVEWPERGAAVLPPPDVTVFLDYQGHRRRLRAEGSTKRGGRLVHCWLQAAEARV